MLEFYKWGDWWMKSENQDEDKHNEEDSLILAKLV